MAKTTSRRALVKTLGLASAAAVLPVVATATAEAQTTKFFHVFGFKWKPQATAADKAKAKKDILAFKGVIPGLLSVSVGDNIAGMSQGYSTVGVLQFSNEADYKAYPNRPAHVALGKWLLPLIDVIELDTNA